MVFWFAMLNFIAIDQKCLYMYLIWPITLMNYVNNFASDFYGFLINIATKFLQDFNVRSKIQKSIGFLYYIQETKSH